MAKSLIFFLFFCFNCICCYGVDFDVVVIGTSPISMLEALYRHYLGNRVLILESASECGGAWKSIDVCGVRHVDLGCHQIGSDMTMVNFLRDYVGCKIVSMDHPDQLFDAGIRGPNGFYFSKGCYEMVNNLEQMIAQTSITLMLNHHVDSIYIDPLQPQALIHTQGEQFSTNKILVTSYSEIKVENHPSPGAHSYTSAKGKYYHLYLLINDASQPHFTYHNGIGGEAISRMMNLTYFAGLENSGQQLIVIQLYNASNFDSGSYYLDVLKKCQLVDSSATLVETQSCIYEQGCYNFSLVGQVPNSAAVFEMIHTGHIQSMSSYIPKWSQVIQPFQMEKGCYLR